ncbi:protein-L-isoaspartate(D-aspartate) O-methyltransferase [Haliangium sp.]|uniref:protein-L-isoaspartate(D-aspartate) O-methyltransferase n=1 Tax=Haliangium sp. TaxID=2663208 RepID=UPI003D0F1CFA
MSDVAEQRYHELRRGMVERQLRGRGITDERVLAAMGTVPRHLFVPPHLRAAAYADSPLEIGHDQTISQPLMVAIMLEALELRGPERVLEVGCGSGYQAALLAKLAAEVYAVEIIPELARGAERALALADIAGVEVIVGDGGLGWPAAAPYDAIVVAAAAPEVPAPLVDQLGDGGRLVLPVGNGVLQTLLRIRKRGRATHSENLGGCAFVPLTGARGVHGRRGFW